MPSPVQSLPLSAEKALKQFPPPVAYAIKSMLTQKRFLSRNALLLQKKSSALSEYCLCCAFLKIHPESQLISLFLVVSASPLRQPGPQFNGQRPQSNKKTAEKIKASVINSSVQCHKWAQAAGGQVSPRSPEVLEPRWRGGGSATSPWPSTLAFPPAGSPPPTWPGRPGSAQTALGGGRGRGRGGGTGLPVTDDVSSEALGPPALTPPQGKINLRLPCSVVKYPPASAGDTGLIPGPGGSHMQWSS